MRLTLRTLLAYLDNILEPSAAQQLAAKIEELEKANLTISQSGDAVIILERARELYPDLPPEEAIEKMMTAADVGKKIIESDNQTDSIVAGAASCEANLNRCTGQVNFLNICRL